MDEALEREDRGEEARVEQTFLCIGKTLSKLVVYRFYSRALEVEICARFYLTSKVTRICCLDLKPVRPCINSNVLPDDPSNIILGRLVTGACIPPSVS